MDRRKTTRTVFAAGAAIAVAATGIATALPADARFEETEFNDAIMCDFDGDGAPTEYLAVGLQSAMWNQRLVEPGVYAVVSVARLSDTEYQSADGESIYATGMSVVHGTFYEATEGFDGRAVVNGTFTDDAGTTLATIFAQGEVINWELADDAVIRIDGPCGLTYEPTE